MSAPLSGILLVDKPAGVTSQRAASVVKRLSGTKVGHTGTLDPMATGLLPLLLGSATRLSAMLTDGDKRYEASMLLGRETDTLDTTGVTLRETAVGVSLSRLEAAISEFSGEIMQTPPMYSAVSVGGERLYKLARKGLEVEREARRVTVYSIELLSFDGERAQIAVSCSKGTYIRSLIADIGASLGCGACMSALRRTACAGFEVGAAVPLDSLTEEGVAALTLPPESLFAGLPMLAPPDFYLHLLQNGQRVDAFKLKAQAPRMRLYGADGFIGLLERDEDRYYLKWRL